MTENEITKQDASMLESVLLGGDLSKLSPPERVNYYEKVCKSLGLNPLTKPFGYITLNGKLVLYALKDATEQLRSIRKVSITQIEKLFREDLYIVTAHASVDGRSDASTGVVDLKGLTGEKLANALMKAETKAKRRVTLSICGMGFLDESEIASIPDAQPVTVTDSGDIESPIDKGIRLYMDLITRANKVGVTMDLIPEHVTIDELRDMYRDMLEVIENAEMQAEDEGTK